MKVDGKEVLTIIFKDGTSLNVIPKGNELRAESSPQIAAATVVGKGNTTIVGSKNVVAGGTIVCGGDFRIGDE